MTMQTPPTPDLWHVIPGFGREHEPSVECWCAPEFTSRDEETGDEVWTHHPEN